MAESGHIWKLLTVVVGILSPNNAALFILLLILRLQAAVGHSLLQDVSVPPLAPLESEEEVSMPWLPLAAV